MDTRRLPVMGALHCCSHNVVDAALRDLTFEITALLSQGIESLEMSVLQGISIFHSTKETSNLTYCRE